MIQANILQFEIITKEKIALCSQVSLKYVTKKGDDLIGHPLGRADGGNRTHDPEITNHVLWPTELHRQWGCKDTIFYEITSNACDNLSKLYIWMKMIDGAVSFSYFIISSVDYCLLDVTLS